MYQSRKISLSESQRQLIEVWGRLAYSWGIGPTMAQIFALLYVHPEPLDSDTILELLAISRGNVSINLRKLIEWGLIRKIDIPGSRRSLYTAERDIWVIAANIVKKRFEREIAPIQTLLEELLARPDVQGDSHTHTALLQIREVVSAVYLVTQLAIPVMVAADRDRFLKILSHWQKRFTDGGNLSGPVSRRDPKTGRDSQPT